MHSDFDLIAVGGGSGGLAVAERAAQLGRRVAVIDPNPLGGTCVNAGCVPKKIMWHAAQAAESVRAASAFGIRTAGGEIDWPALVGARDRVLADINEYWAGYLRELGVEHVRARARLLDGRSVAVGDRRLGAEHIVIATGSRPVVPGVPGAELGITSDGFFALADRPRRVAVVGAGYVGVELAGVLRALGSEVSLFALEPRVLAAFDPWIGDHLGAALEAQGVELRLDTAVAGLARRGGAIALRTTAGARHEGLDAVIWAVGRRPNSDRLGLAEIGLATGAAGHIAVDADQRTACPSVFAIGDVTGATALTPVAIYHGRRLAERLFSPLCARPQPAPQVPTVVFSHPPAATVGLAEAQACARFDAVRVYETRFQPLGRALQGHAVPTAMKLVCAGPEERVVGIHMVGDGVEEMLQGFAVALNLGLTKAQLDRTLAIHPTGAEELVTLKAARPGGCGAGLERAA